MCVCVCVYIYIYIYVHLGDVEVRVVSQQAQERAAVAVFLRGVVSLEHLPAGEILKVAAQRDVVHLLVIDGVRLACRL